MCEVNIKGWKCKRCGHTWKPLREARPKQCPKCKSPYWQRDVVRHKVSEARRKVTE